MNHTMIETNQTLLVVRETIAWSGKLGPRLGSSMLASLYKREMDIRANTCAAISITNATKRKYVASDTWWQMRNVSIYLL